MQATSAVTTGYQSSDANKSRLLESKKLIKVIQLNPQDESITPLFIEAEHVFMRAFAEGYANFSLKDLNLEGAYKNNEEFLNDALQGEKDAFTDASHVQSKDEQGTHFFVAQTIIDSKVVGYASVKYFSHEIHLAQACIDPAHQRQGHFTNMLSQIVEPAVQDTDKEWNLTWNTRVINKPAKQFAQKFEATKTPAIHDYNSESYIGYTKKISPNMFDMFK